MSLPRKAAPTFYPGGFDVTAVIGRVEFSNLGEEKTPVQAALELIGRHSPRVGEDSITYLFPHEDGGNVEVTIGHVPERSFES